MLLTPSTSEAGSPHNMRSRSSPTAGRLPSTASSSSGPSSTATTTGCSRSARRAVIAPGRVVHADGDATGAEVMRALTEAVQTSDRAQIIETRVVDLVMIENRVAGVVTADGKDRQVLLAPAVVLATGGAGRLYSRTTNPPGVTGDGIAMAGTGRCAVGRPRVRPVPSHGSTGREGPDAPAHRGAAR